MLASVILIFVVGFQFFNRTLKYMAHTHRNLRDADQIQHKDAVLTQHPLQQPRCSAFYVLCMMAMAFSMVCVYVYICIYVYTS